MKAERLEREFAARGVRHDGGLLLLAPSDALALVARAAEEGVPILGVDGMRVREGVTEASHDHVADFSSAVAEGHGCWQDAEAFIRARRELGLVFELTLGSDPLEVV